MHPEEQERERNPAHAARLRSQVHLSMYRSMVISGCLVSVLALYEAVFENPAAAIFFGVASPFMFVCARIYRREVVARNLLPQDARLVNLAAVKSWSFNRWLLTGAGAAILLMIAFRRN